MIRFLIFMYKAQRKPSSHCGWILKWFEICTLVILSGPFIISLFNKFSEWLTLFDFIVPFFCSFSEGLKWSSLFFFQLLVVFMFLCGVLKFFQWFCQFVGKVQNHSNSVFHLYSLRRPTWSHKADGLTRNPIGFELPDCGIIKRAFCSEF